MSFITVRDALHSRAVPSCGVGLPGLKKILVRLGSPQKNLQIIHVAGTNGKGSVSYLTESVFRAAGYKTGLFISPHLTDLTERIQINGKPVSKLIFTQALEKVFAAETEKLNFFEALTVAALLIFKEAKTDFVVLETGLGGRKDPTNVCTPRATYLTSVDKDHTALLGGTIAQIAAEKAGIIKRNIPCFCSVQSPVARRVIRQSAKMKFAPLVWVREGQPWRELKFNLLGNETVLFDGERRWPLHVLGRKQAVNACGVYQLAQFFKISDAAIKRGFAQVRVPARFEVIQTARNVIFLDGAHNPAAIEGLLDFIHQTPFAKGSVLLCALMKDKDYRTIINRLAPHFTKLILTAVLPGRSAAEADFKKVLPPNSDFVFYPAWQTALREVFGYKRVVCCGSFYLAGAVRSMLSKERYI